MSKLWRVEFRRQAWPFVAATVILATLGTVRAVSRSEVVDLIFQLASLLAWSGLVGYTAMGVYQYYYLGRDVLMHLNSNGRSAACFRRLGVSVSYLFALFMILLALDIPVVLRSTSEVNLTALLGYYVVARLVSLAAFALVVLAVVGGVKGIQNKVLAAASAVTLFGALTVGQAFLLWALVRTPTASWSIGISNSFQAPSSYVNVLPIVIEPGNLLRVTDNLPFVSVLLNGLLAAVCLFGWLALARRKTLSFYAR